jgi:hypothetical protein
MRLSHSTLRGRNVRYGTHFPPLHLTDWIYTNLTVDFELNGLNKKTNSLQKEIGAKMKARSGGGYLRWKLI